MLRMKCLVTLQAVFFTIFTGFSACQEDDCKEDDYTSSDFKEEMEIIWLEECAATYDIDEIFWSSPYKGHGCFDEGAVKLCLDSIRQNGCEYFGSSFWCDRVNWYAYR